MKWGEDEAIAALVEGNMRVDEVRNEPSWRRTHNVAPGSFQPVYRSSSTVEQLHTGDKENGGYVLQSMK
jgi:hypothetical protein